MDPGRISLIVLSILLVLAVVWLVIVIVFPGNKGEAAASSLGDVALNLPVDDTGQVGGVGALGEIPPFVTVPPPDPFPTPSTPAPGTDPCMVNGKDVCVGTWKLYSPSGDDGADPQNGDIILIRSFQNPITDADMKVYKREELGGGIPTPAFRFKQEPNLGPYLNIRNEEAYSFTREIGNQYLTIMQGVVEDGANSTLVTKNQSFTPGAWSRVVLVEKGGNLVMPIFWNVDATDFRVVDWSNQFPKMLTAEEAGARPVSNFVLEMTQVDTNTWP